MDAVELACMEVDLARQFRTELLPVCLDDLDAVQPQTHAVAVTRPIHTEGVGFRIVRLDLASPAPGWPRRASPPPVRSTDCREPQLSGWIPLSAQHGREEARAS